MPEPRIVPLSESEWTAEQREILDRIFEGGTRARNMFTTVVRHPRILRRWSAFGGVLLSRTLLSLYQCRTDRTDLRGRAISSGVPAHQCR